MQGKITTVFLFFSFMMFFEGVVFGQGNNPETIHIISAPDQTIEFEIHSNQSLTLDQGQLPSFVDVNSLQYSFAEGVNSFRMKLLPDVELGNYDFYIDYIGGAKGQTSPQTIEIAIQVKSSFVEVQNDYVSSSNTSETITIDVLANDYSSSDELMLSNDLVLVDGGTAEVVNNQILFRPAENQESSNAFIQYTAYNEFGESESGKAIISINGQNQETTKDYYTGQFTPVTITLPNEISDSDINLSSSYGAYTVLSPSHVLFTPDGQSLGSEQTTIPLENGLEYEINMNVLELDNNTSPVKDDVFYISRGQTLTANVFDNDLKKTRIMNSPKGITVSSAGTVVFDAPERFTGIKRFNLNYKDKGANYTSTITIIVSEFLPIQDDEVVFTMFAGSPLYITYDIPIKEFQMNELTSPSFGYLTRIEEDEVNYTCAVSGESTLILTSNTLVYQTAESFVGEDRFTLEYCASGTCKEIDVFVKVLSKEDDCHCVGPDCVWAGDANADGQVNMLDVLAVGYNMGLSGTERPRYRYQWAPEQSEDWGHQTLDLNGLDAKHSDANGDGQVDLSDLDVIEINHGKTHELITKDLFAQIDFPVYIVPDKLDFVPGDVLHLDIVAGSEQHPVVDIHGVTYTLNLPEDRFDIESAESTTPKTSFLANNSPLIEQINKDFLQGKIDAGISRTRAEKVSGHGTIQSIDIVIVDLIDGAKTDEETVEIPITIDNISVLDVEGNYKEVEPQTVTITVNRAKEPEGISSENIDVFLSPNPSSDATRIYANNNDVIQSIELVALSGQSIKSIQNINQKEYSLNLVDVQDGSYIARITTAKGVINKKMVVMR